MMRTIKIICSCIAAIGVCIGGGFALGQHLGEAKCARDTVALCQETANQKAHIADSGKEIDSLKKEKLFLSQENDALKVQLASSQERIASLQVELASCGGEPRSLELLGNGKLGKGLGIGVNTGKGLYNWLEPVTSKGELCMAYPKGQGWGTVFITVGEPVPLGRRKGKDFSQYTKLVLELKGRKKGTTVQVGLKDSTALDNGSETKVSLKLTEEWDTYEIDLNKFTGTNLKDLYVVTEFVFGDEPQSLCVRKIQFQ